MQKDAPSILQHAKVQLGLSPEAAGNLVPAAYLNELAFHRTVCPEDMNFRITAQPARGYGKLSCLEKGCEGVVINLEHSKRVADGGKQVGVGSLAPYRRHIAEHATHSRSRLARVKAVNGTPMKTTTSGSNKSASSLSASSSTDLTPLERARQRVSLGRTQRSRNDPIVIGSSPVSSPVEKSLGSPLQSLSTDPSSSGQKRPNDSSVPFEPSITPPSKKLKTISSPKTPLGVNNNSTTTVMYPWTVPAQPLHVDHSDTRARIDDLQRQISHKQSLLDNLLRKKKPSKQDLSRIENYKHEISSYRALRDELKASLPSASPFKKASVSSIYRSEPSPRKIPALDLLPKKPDPSRLPLVAPPSFPFVPKQEPGTSMLPHSAGAASSMTPRFDASFHLRTPTVAGSLHTGLKSEPGLRGSSAFIDPPAAGSSSRSPQSAKHEDTDMDDDYHLGLGQSDDLGVNSMVVQKCQDVYPAIAPVGGYDSDHFDDQGNFYGRGRDTFQGPVAKADDIDKFLIEAGNAELFDGTATVEQAVVKLGLPSLYAPLAGMDIALMPHQVIGVAWMVEKENSNLKGGCLGDDMGLGKTVQMIAVMMKNRSSNPKCKTNLILAPAALLEQWKLEIELKTADALKCLIYHGSSKPRKKSDLLSYDVVITTYQTMAFEWPDIEKEQRKKAKKKKSQKDDFIVSDSDSNDMKDKRKKHELGLLFQVDFYRVVLDEAQAIRNKKTRVSRAVTSLNSTYRWCLTGTPIINGLADTYAYLRFLQIRPWYDFKEFQSHIGKYEKKRPELAVMRLQKVFDTFLLRRKKDTMLDGKRLIELPPKGVALQRLKFTEEEREIYQMLETKMQGKFNRFLRAGTVLKNYHYVLVLLLRLRQCCSHPSLIQEEGVAFVAPDELDDTGKVLKRARDLVSPEFVEKLKAKFKEVVLKRMADEKESADATVEEEECSICYDTFTNAVVTACGHIFCKQCVQEVLNTPYVEKPNEVVQYKPHQRPCPACHSPIESELLFERAAFEPTEEDLKPSTGLANSDVDMIDLTKSPSGGKGKGKGKARPKRNAKKTRSRIVVDSDDEGIIDVDALDSSSDYEDDEDDDMSDFIVESDEDEEEKDARRDAKKRLGKRKAMVVLDSDEEIEDERHRVYHGKRDRESLSAEEIKLLPRFLPSTKMMYMMKYIRKLAEERPDEKVLVISQWTSCLDLVSKYLEENSIIHVKFQGDMTRTHRDKAVRAFMSKDKATVMLMSLKCGGVGLNLTRANHVVSLDLGWSQAIEDQAFDRVHRLGQSRPVTVERLVIENTVEDRILNMQERKQMLADGSLGEGKGKKIGKLSVKELANLFGLDHRGQRLSD